MHDHCQRRFFWCLDQAWPRSCMLLQGDTVTKGLKKVTDDMKTKNRADRSGVVSTSAGMASTELLKWPRRACRILKQLPHWR